MTGLPATVNPTSERSVAYLTALVITSPFVELVVVRIFIVRVDIESHRLLRIFFVATLHLLHLITAVTLYQLQDFAISAQKRVTWSRTSVFAARHELPANLPTAEASIVVGIRTSFLL